MGEPDERWSNVRAPNLLRANCSRLPHARRSKIHGERIYFFFPGKKRFSQVGEEGEDRSVVIDLGAGQTGNRRGDGCLMMENACFEQEKERRRGWVSESGPCLVLKCSCVFESLGVRLCVGRLPCSFYCGLLMISSQLDSKTTGITITVCLLIIRHIIFYSSGQRRL